MNCKFTLSIAVFAAVGLMGCDSRSINYKQVDDVTSGTTSAPAVDLSEQKMKDRKVAPTYDQTERTDGFNEEAIADEEAFIDDKESVASGSTSEAMDDTKASYSQTDLPGGMAPEDRNLRFGLIGNGTGMGLEDTTSKNMTDNYTLSDPTISHHSLTSSGALSAPTEDQDALKDIKSGTSFDPENYYIDDEN